MAKKVFYSFDFGRDAYRVGQVRNIGAVEGSTLLADNAWEAIERGGDKAIQAWIDSQMKGRVCMVVLVGARTSKRRWVDYEIKKAWKDGMGLCGIRIHGLQDGKQQTDRAGLNPFSNYNIDGTALDRIVPLHDPAGATSKDVYASIAKNIENWVDDAIKIRKRYK